MPARQLFTESLQTPGPTGIHGRAPIRIRRRRRLLRTQGGSRHDRGDRTRITVTGHDGRRIVEFGEGHELSEPDTSLAQRYRRGPRLNIPGGHTRRVPGGYDNSLEQCSNRGWLGWGWGGTTLGLALFAGYRLLSPSCNRLSRPSATSSRLTRQLLMHHPHRVPKPVPRRSRVPGVSGQTLLCLFGRRERNRLRGMGSGSARRRCRVPGLSGPLSGTRRCGSAGPVSSARGPRPGPTHRWHAHQPQPAPACRGRETRPPPQLAASTKSPPLRVNDGGACAQSASPAVVPGHPVIPLPRNPSPLTPHAPSTRRSPCSGCRSAPASPSGPAPWPPCGRGDPAGGSSRSGRCPG